MEKAESNDLETMMENPVVIEEESHFVWEDCGPHPLCIPHIADNILSYLEVLDLRRSRLINSQYNDLACRKLPNKQVISFNKAERLSSYLSLLPPPTSSSPIISSFEDKTTTTGCNNVTAIIPAHSKFQFNFDPEESDPSACKDFFHTLGHQIKELHYTTDLIPFNAPKRLVHMGHVWTDTPHLETLSLEIKWGCPALLFENDNVVSLPSLKKLVLDILITDREADRASLFLTQLLSATPNLEEITIPGHKKFFDDYINVMLGRTILNLNLPFLYNLDFCLALNPSQVFELAQKNFPLKFLILDFAEVHRLAFPDQNALLDQAFQILFSKLSSTLESIHLCFPEDPGHPLHRFTFPQPMAKLRHFALGKFRGSVSILDSLPALVKLEIWNVEWNDFNNGEGCEECSHNNNNGSQPQLELELEAEQREHTHHNVVPTKYLSITSVIS